MAVSKLLPFGLGVFIFFNPSISFASDLDAELLKMLESDVQQNMVNLSDAITRCQLKAKESQNNAIDIAYLTTVNMSKKVLLESLYYLNIRNFSLCEKQARQSLSFSINQLVYTHQELGLKAPKLAEQSNNLLYQPLHDIKLKLKFESLSRKMGMAIEKAVGNKPFNFPEISQKLTD